MFAALGPVVRLLTKSNHQKLLLPTFLQRRLFFLTLYFKMTAVSEASFKITSNAEAPSSSSLMRSAPTTNQQIPTNTAEVARPTTTTVQSYPSMTVQNSNYPTTSYPTYPTTTTTVHGTTYPTSTYPVTATTTYGTSPMSSHDSAVQSAINQGRIYAPLGAVFVPGHVALQSGMHTIYDSKLIPTFETPLVFHSASSTIMSAPAMMPRGATEVTEKSKFIIPHQKKSACC